MQNLIETCRKIGKLSQENEKVLIRSILQIECGPKTLLQEQDKVYDSIYFVEKSQAETYISRNHRFVFRKLFHTHRIGFFLRGKSVNSVLWCYCSVFNLNDEQL